MSNRNKTEKTKDKSVNISIPNDIKEDDLKKILVDAILEAETKKKETELNENDKKVGMEFQESNDEVDTKKHNNSCKSKYLDGIVALFKIMFLRKKDITDFDVIDALLRTALYMFLITLHIITLLGSIFMIGFPILSYFIASIEPLAWYWNLFFIAFGIALFPFSQCFRIASVEVDNIKDKNYLFGLFSSVTSVVSIIVAVTAIVIKVG